MSEASALAASSAARPALADEVSTTVDDAGESLRVGRRLRAAREAKQISVVEAAQALKLAPRQVEAIEAEEWASLPGNTMIRGFVRNYARIVQLDPEALMRALDAAQLPQTMHLDVSAGTSATLPQAGRHAERRDYLTVLVGLLLLAIAVLAYLYFPTDLLQARWSAWFGGGAAPIVQPAATSPPVVAAAAPPAAATERSPLANGQSVITLTAPNATVLSDQQPATAASPTATGSTLPAGGGTPGGGVLKVKFVDAAWAEIRDARGQLLLYGTNAAGSQRELDGQPPFSLNIGNASQVRIEYRGQVVDLAPHSKGNVAKMVLE